MVTGHQWVAFTPRDTVLVRDGRPFDAGADVVAEPTLPGPSTVAGAVYQAYHQREPDEVRGPLLAQRVETRWTTYLPAPADVVVPPNAPHRLTRLRPERLDAVTDLADAGTHLLTGEGDPVGGWWTSQTLARYLAGSLIRGSQTIPVSTVEPRFADTAEVWAPEWRIGLARDERHTAREGLLYQATHLRPVEGVALLAECIVAGSDDKPGGPVPLGGMGRLADVEVVTGVDWPARPSTFPDGRVLVYVATPAVWPDGWRIPVPDGAELVAAVVGTPLPVATASPRLGIENSRALRWAVPPGSVYLLRFTGADGAERAAMWARQWHGIAYGRAGRDRLRTAGFGVVLTGVWS